MQRAATNPRACYRYGSLRDLPRFSLSASGSLLLWLGCFPDTLFCALDAVLALCPAKNPLGEISHWVMTAFLQRE